MHLAGHVMTHVHIFLEMFMNNFPGVPLLNLKVNNYNLIINSIITKEPNLRYR